jgi:hypothetical protein
VILSFETKKYGPMRYFTDVFGGRGWYRSSGGYQSLPGWQMNARAIALGLESLRKVDRYGIASRGEQYTGWSALPPATPMGAAMTVEDAARFLAENANLEPVGEDDTPWDVLIIEEGEAREIAYKMCAKRLHPDVGGSKEDFQKLQEAKRILDEAVA